MRDSDRFKFSFDISFLKVFTVTNSNLAIRFLLFMYELYSVDNDSGEGIVEFYATPNPLLLNKICLN